MNLPTIPFPVKDAFRERLFHPLRRLVLLTAHIGPHEASALLLLMKQYHILARLFQ